MTEMIRTNPSMRQKFIEAAIQHDPAFGQELSENPALLDSMINMASAQADHENSNLQIDMFTAEEREAVQRVSCYFLLFNR